MQVTNIYLVVSCWYLVSGMKYNIRRPISIFREKSAQENAVVDMQEKMLKHAADFSERLDQTKKSPNPNLLVTYNDKVIFGDDFPTTMTKTDLELFILREAGIANRGVLVDAIFSYVDQDGGGTISREELQFFVEDFNPRQSLLEHLNFVIAVCFKERLVGRLAMFFSSASVLSISNNISRGFGSTLWDGAISVSMAIGYIYVVGCLAFVA
uniref:EF-hand domain-containing protein n=1 Tax=Chaetoceros debilis TaxID=122233 RepID=A0A7S3Q2S6_9STRA|mmetsp:Transcript_15596/g.23371  ORF Transcript_15596/g.23371 Transcript_15596/m.23371 type:complete len:211 (+) Transcript_15596:425-1057(+)|eukprot:CAMPEP_0194120480 /NCGR_PEP_ID=MMETSP0150-20130528/43645_1 /TAXON_ID=122233 /ORGANISM="Chaetoceros debilis, Strain MM31A-1" /LENGTH=210 /DNA_ID=CAMNT_0038812611 /DNA_START=417 /DNA_END=1049 /DNA_ORIENTATION=+